LWWGQTEKKSSVNLICLPTQCLVKGASRASQFDWQGQVVWASAQAANNSHLVVVAIAPCEFSGRVGSSVALQSFV
jgi:hypothetical protein